MTGPILSGFICLRARSSRITLSKCSRKRVDHFNGLQFEAELESANQGENFIFKIFVDFDEGGNHNFVEEEPLLCVSFKAVDATDGCQVYMGLLLCDSRRSNLRKKHFERVAYFECSFEGSNETISEGEKDWDKFEVFEACLGEPKEIIII